VDGPVEFPTPAALMMEMVTVSASWGGVITVILLSPKTARSLPFTPPNRTEVVPENPDPVMVTIVPPARGPPPGVMPVISGAGAAATKAGRRRMRRTQDTVRNGPGFLITLFVCSLTPVDDTFGPLKILFSIIFTII
jgi:hypothetical protein